MTRRRWRISLTRDLILYIVALSGLIYEIVNPGSNESEVITGCVAILLSPVALNDDRRRLRRRRRQDDEP